MSISPKQTTKLLYYTINAVITHVVYRLNVSEEECLILHDPIFKRQSLYKIFK